jgi:hypothetical protein
LPAPNEPPTIRVSFGTSAFATACTIFAPSLAMPPRSYPPDHEPVMFWRKEQRHLAARAELDEVRRLERGLREEDAVVRDDPTRKPESRAKPQPAWSRTAP